MISKSLGFEVHNDREELMNNIGMYPAGGTRLVEFVPPDGDLIDGVYTQYRLSSFPKGICVYLQACQTIDRYVKMVI